jgi:hypothetical protein
VLHRVDVGCVDHGDALGCRIVADELHPSRLDRRQRTAVRNEPGSIVRPRQDDKLAGRRPEHATAADRPPGERVEERRLAGARRSHEQHDQWSVERPGTRADVAGEVIRELGDPATRRLPVQPGLDGAHGQRIDPVDERGQLGGFRRRRLVRALPCRSHRSSVERPRDW